MDDAIATASNEVLEHEVTTLAGQIAAATCRMLLLISELDRREAWRSCWGCRAMSQWLAWRCAMSPKTAYEHVRVARALSDLPLTVAAFERGELSYSKVRVFTRIATAENEAELIDMARAASAAQLDRIVRASIVAASDPEKREAMRELSFDVDADGFGTVWARGPVEEHAIVEQAVAASVATIKEATKACPEESPAGDSAAQQRWDALVRVCESYLAHGDHARAPQTRNSAVIHVTMTEKGVEDAATENGRPVQPETTRRILCDAGVQGMLGGLDGPLGCGRQTRTISRKLRRALNRRSGGRCEWLGCNESKFVEGHHVWHWADGGPTELWNLVNLCWHHHHLVHEGGWRIEHDGRGHVRSFRPDGGELRDVEPVTMVGGLTVVVEPDAITPTGDDERFDLSACVDAVLSVREGRVVVGPLPS